MVALHSAITLKVCLLDSISIASRTKQKYNFHYYFANHFTFFSFKMQHISSLNSYSYTQVDLLKIAFVAAPVVNLYSIMK
jgi:hypothetical protein